MSASAPKHGSGDASGVHHIEIRDLRCFLALAEEMHFGRAAERLGMAQPVLSRKIAALEDDIGGRLFDRTRAQIKLTPAGTTLLQRARDLLQRLDDMVDVTRRVAGGSEGLLQIGFVSSATFSILPGLVGEFHRRYPSVELRFHHMNKADLFHALIERRIQIALTRAGIEDAEIVNDTLRRERMIVALPEGDPLGSSVALSLTDLADKPFIAPKASVDDHIRDLCARAGFQPRIVQETMDLQTSLSLVAAGLGAALVPESARAAPRSGVAYRDIADPMIYTDFMISFRRDNADRLLHLFRAITKQYAAGAPPTKPA